MEVKLSSASRVENFRQALSSSLSFRKLYLVTESEYNNVPRTVLEVFSPFLALLLTSTNQEETPTIILQDVKSQTIKNFVDLIQTGAIHITTRNRDQITEDILDLAKVLNIEMKNLNYEGNSVQEREVNKESLLSDELLLYEENLFCQELLKEEYTENTTEEYFESMTIDDHVHDQPIKKENVAKEEENAVESIRENVAVEDMREDGEISDDDDVYTFQCPKCQYGCGSMKDLMKHSEMYHRTDRPNSRSDKAATTKKYSRHHKYSCTNCDKFITNSESSLYNHLKYHHRFKTPELIRRFLK